MAHPGVHLTLAWYVLGLASDSHLKKWADTLLSDGIYSYSLGELFSYSSFSTANPTWLFENAVQELGMALPSREKAAVQLAGDCLVGIAEGRRTPAEGLSTVRHSLAYPFQNGDDLIEATGCQDFMKYAYQYEYQLEVIEFITAQERDRQMQELDGAVMPLIEKWIRDRLAVPFAVQWRTANVCQLAEGISQTRAFERLAILADALEDAGCTNEQILDHCRSRSDHARCCWVVDLILSKS